MNYYLKCLQQYADFSGRARRKEYWMFYLFNFIAAIVLSIIDSVLGSNFLSSIYSLLVLIPGLAVSVRRLHDVGKSGWMFFINFIPIIGWIWFLVLAVTDSQAETNKWGENPKANEMA